jgi:hypothetical protein
MSDEREREKSRLLSLEFEEREKQKASPEVIAKMDLKSFGNTGKETGWRMLRWKQIAGLWHLTYEDISVCRLVLQMEIQTKAKICLACLDAIADERVQWLNPKLKVR